jgi:hypothetical protein
VRRTIGTDSPHVGMITPTGGSAPRTARRCTGTARLQPLKTFSSAYAAENRHAPAKGHDSHRAAGLSEVSIHGRNSTVVRTTSTPAARMRHCWRTGG